MTKTTIPKGWKLTKLGHIPSEWWDGKIQDLVDEEIIFKPMDGNHGNIHPKSSDYVENGIPFVMANDIINEYLCIEKTSKIKKSQADNLQKGFSNSGDVLFTHKGSVGNTAIVPELNTDYIMLTPQVTYYRIKKYQKLHPLFLRKLFQSNRFQSLLENLSAGGTRAYIGISAQRNLPFYYPPLPEQEKIVEVLETRDNYLEKLSQTIEAKKKIKKGLMQKLLTGKTKLPGFSEEWEIIKLGEICEIVSGSTPSTSNPSYWNGNILWVTPTEITQLSGKYLENTKRKITEKGLKSCSAKVIPPKSLILCSRATVGDCAINLGKITTNQGFKNIIPKHNKLDIEFLYYWINTKKHYLKSISSGSTFLEFSKSDLARTKLNLPPLPEQIAIAQILTTADQEIEALEKKKAIIGQQKKFLLNNLITGKIRLPEFTN